MRKTGIVRGVDALGRIVLPKELRTTMGLETDSKLEIYLDGDAIVLKRHRPEGCCDFCCELDNDMAEYAGYRICSSCRSKIGAL